MNNNLKSLREMGTWLNEQERELPINDSPQKSATAYNDLYNLFLPYLDASEQTFRDERFHYLLQHQERLKKLSEWQKTEPVKRIV